MTPEGGAGGWGSAGADLAVAVGAALAGVYAKARGEPEPWTLRAMTARMVDGLAAGALAVGVAGALKAWWRVEDIRLLIGISAALGMIGVSSISDALTRAVRARVGGP